MTSATLTGRAVRSRRSSPHYYPKGWFLRTTASVLASVFPGQQQQPSPSSSALAFVVQPPPVSTTTRRSSSMVLSPSLFPHPFASVSSFLPHNDDDYSTSSNHRRSYSTTPTRLFWNSRNNNNNNNDNNSGGGGILSTLKRAAQSILPSRWFPKSEEEQRREAMVKQEREFQKEVSGGLTELLRGAPLPIRMLGSLMTPLFSSALSSLAQAAQEQQATVNQVLDQATICLVQDATVRQVLGDPVQVASSSPLSQRSATSTINGQTTQQIQVTVPISGSLDTGIATITATERGLQSIRVQAQRSGRILQVPTTTTTTSRTTVTGGGGGGPSWNKKKYNGEDDNIIEAEIIEKKDNTPSSSRDQKDKW
ncbi:hypothetical protein ACA910_005150 [Epithemia clementina (nom. ined.)]